MTELSNERVAQALEAILGPGPSYLKILNAADVLRGLVHSSPAERVDVEPVAAPQAPSPTAKPVLGRPRDPTAELFQFDDNRAAAISIARRLVGSPTTAAAICREAVRRGEAHSEKSARRLLAKAVGLGLVIRSGSGYKPVGVTSREILAIDKHLNRVAEAVRAGASTPSEIVKMSGLRLLDVYNLAAKGVYFRLFEVVNGKLIAVGPPQGGK